MRSIKLNPVFSLKYDLLHTAKSYSAGHFSVLYILKRVSDSVDTVTDEASIVHLSNMKQEFILLLTVYTAIISANQVQEEDNTNEVSDHAHKVYQEMFSTGVDISKEMKKVITNLWATPEVKVIINIVKDKCHLLPVQ